nr:KICSTOR complex protein kaptin-like isoform X2 [Onthophagus taurus]
MQEGMENLNHAHYFPMPSQGNVNTICFLKLINGTYKILVASLKRQVFCLEYLEKPNSILIPTTKEIPFTYIPSSSEIITIDAFNKSDKRNDFVIGITIIKSCKDLVETYLNIYSEYEDNEEINIDNIAQNCFNVQLNFIPHFHGHTDLIKWKDNKLVKREPVFILTGNDRQVHMYKEDNLLHTFQEILFMEYFPEFYKTPDMITWIEIQYFNNYSQRLTVFGTEAGYVRMCRICVKTKTIIFNHSTNFISYVSQVKIFEEHKSIKKPRTLIKNNEHDLKDMDENDFPVLNVIVTNTSLPSVVFFDCIKNGLDQYKTLRRTEVVSISSCVEVADLDFDGEDEILLGNSRQGYLHRAQL